MALIYASQLPGVFFKASIKTGSIANIKTADRVQSFSSKGFGRQIISQEQQEGLPIRL